MTFTIHGFWLRLRFTLGTLALVSFVYLRFWSAESARRIMGKRPSAPLEKAETLAIGSFLYVVGNHPDRVPGSRDTQRR